jgi:hypothetical protein
MWKTAGAIRCQPAYTVRLSSSRRYAGNANDGMVSACRQGTNSPLTTRPTDSRSPRRLQTADSHGPYPFASFVLRAACPAGKKHRSRQWRRHGSIRTYQIRSRSCTRIAVGVAWPRMARRCEGRWGSGAGGGLRSKARGEARTREAQRGRRQRLAATSTARGAVWMAPSCSAPQRPRLSEISSAFSPGEWYGRLRLTR